MTHKKKFIFKMGFRNFIFLSFEFFTSCHSGPPNAFGESRDPESGFRMTIGNNKGV